MTGLLFQQDPVKTNEPGNLQISQEDTGDNKCCAHPVHHSEEDRPRVCVSVA